MDLRTLEHFLVVVAEGSITRAAERLHMSQPPLTVRLKALEAELGVELLHRHGRGVEPTAAGRLLAERSRRLLEELETTTAAVQSTGHGVAGHLTLAIGGAIAPGVITDLVGALAREAPQVTFTVTDQPDATVLDRVAHNEADAGLLHTSPADEASRTRAVETAVVLREPLVAVLDESHRAGRGERADLAQLRDEPLIVPSRSSSPSLHAQLSSAWRAAGGDPTRIREADATTTILALVQAGLGIAVIPASLAQVAWRPLRALPLLQHYATIETAITWRPSTGSPVLRRFLRLALSTPEPDVLEPNHARRQVLTPFIMPAALNGEPGRGNDSA